MTSMKNGQHITSSDIIPRRASTAELRQWISHNLKCEMPIAWSAPFDKEVFNRNIENYVGTVHLPLGIAGPVLIKGEYAKGLFYVPFATTEGLLVDSYGRGMLAASQAGGVTTKILSSHIDISPLFILSDSVSEDDFSLFLKSNERSLFDIVKTKTSHGRLIRYEMKALDPSRVIVTFFYDTADAMGLNMINVATESVCDFIKSKCPVDRYYLRSNYSSDKKVSYHNFFSGYGKSVMATAVFPEAVIKNYLGATVEQVYDFWHQSFLASQRSGILGINAQFANGLAAIYIATGQDVAQVVNASSGTTIMNKRSGELMVTVSLPSLVVGTYGGGTRLPTQAESLKLMGCLGEGSVMKFSEIITSAVLCGEISICAALSIGVFAKAHDKKRTL